MFSKRSFKDLNFLFRYNKLEDLPNLANNFDKWKMCLRKRDFPH